jgi:hypothetical protein
MNPASGSPTPAAGRGRLEAAYRRFEQQCHTRVAREPIFTSAVFGSISVKDYITFHELHTLHHRKQITGES